MNQDGYDFKYIRELFPSKSKAKLQQNVFVGPEVRKLQRHKIFKTKLTSGKLAA